MTDPSHSLGTLQRWMQAVIMHPLGAEAGIESPAAREEIDLPADDVGKVIDPSRSLGSLDRLEIYAGAYYARLLECLREEYAVLCKMLGQELFDGFALGYLQRYPSRSYTLVDLGRDFPTFLQELREHSRDEDGDADDESWPLLMVELATFERMVHEVFDGPGAEDQPLLSADDLAPIDPRRWPEARLVPVPCLRVAAFEHPVHLLYTSAKTVDEVLPPGPQPSWAALTRRDYVVRNYDISQPQYELLAAVLAGCTVGESIERAARVADPDLEALARQLHDWFRQWAAQGFFRSVEFPG